MKRLALVAVLALVGLGLVTAGIAFIFWPAALVVAGALCLAAAVLIDIPERRSETEAVTIVDESEEPIATVMRVRG